MAGLGIAIACASPPVTVAVAAEAAAAPDSAALAASAASFPSEQRCDDLADALRLRAADLRGAEGADTVSVVEAEEIARVADDFVTEGDYALAEDLLREALALIAAAEPSAP